jgi:3-hydroxyisobutyrate dehydrogenase-like beta-hydroxyacid dehydrogenase
LKTGAVHIDHTTTSAQIAIKLAAAAAERGAEFMDGPVSGGQAGAENGQLTVMLGGEQSTFDKCKAVMQAFSKSMTLIGPVGAGQKAKMANQICIAGVVQGLAEAIHFLKAADLDVEKVISAISKGAAQSWQMENRYQTMIRDEYDFGFAVDWMRKDLGIALQEANNVGAQLPVTALVDQFYADVQAIGGSRWDTSSLHARLQTRKAK